MKETLEAIKESNRLLAEQNALLQRIAANGTPQAEVESEDDGMMTDRDLSMILMSDDIYAAIDKWNQRCDERAKRRKACKS